MMMVKEKKKKKKNNNNNMMKKKERAKKKKKKKKNQFQQYSVHQEDPSHTKTKTRQELHSVWERYMTDDVCILLSCVEFCSPVLLQSVDSNHILVDWSKQVPKSFKRLVLGSSGTKQRMSNTPKFDRSATALQVCCLFWIRRHQRSTRLTKWNGMEWMSMLKQSHHFAFQSRADKLYRPGRHHGGDSRAWSIFNLDWSCP